MRCDAVLSSRIRLARNYEDFPFDLAKNRELAEVCISRTENALRLSPDGEDFTLLRLSDMSQEDRQAMSDMHLISQDLLRFPDSAAVLMKNDESAVIMMNEEDHLRIQSIAKGLDLLTPASRCFGIEDTLSRQVSFAFDDQLGYLTACPTNTGTGMRASVLMHLPMLTLGKQMGNVGQTVAKVGLNIRGVYGEGSEALGNIYQVSNQVTLGRTEEDLIAAVTAVANQLSDMEAAIREKTLLEKPAYTEDLVFRSWGILTNARLMPLTEFYRNWSGVRLGASRGLLEVDPERLDTLPEAVQNACLRAKFGVELDDDALLQKRAELIREALTD